jgi:nucleoside-diphosphate-sugar epimerase
MRILITGTEGKVGNEILYLLSKNNKYKLFSFTKKKIIKNKKKIKFFKQDLTKPIKHKLNVDIIIHCASKNPLSKYKNDSKKIYSTNIKMTKNLINFSNKSKVKKIVFLSAMDIYGSIKKNIIFENEKKLNLNAYGKSKLMSEKLFCNKKNLFKTICLRVPGIFITDLKRDRPLIISLVKKIIKNQDIYVYNLSSKFNNVMDSNEIVKFIKLIFKKKIKSEVYNFSASRPIKFIKVLKIIIKIFKSSSNIIKKKTNKKSFLISNKKIKNNFNFKISSTEKIITRCCHNIASKNFVKSQNF